MSTTLSVVRTASCRAAFPAAHPGIRLSSGVGTVSLIRMLSDLNGLSLAASIRPAASTVGPAAVLVRARVTRAHQEDEKNHQKNEA